MQKPAVTKKPQPRFVKLLIFFTKQKDCNDTSMLQTVEHWTF